MRRIRLLLCGSVAAGVVAASHTAALASPANTPAPIPGTPSCNGLIIAEFNQDSGPSGPSGNPNASAGPGVFLGSGTHEAIVEDARGPNC
jgi:hypothetical protein